MTEGYDVLLQVATYTSIHIRFGRSLCTQQS